MKQIPIIFGVTGHRDLREQDIEKLKDSVGGIFDEFKAKYPNTELVLISALAEGADMLVADVAISKGVKLFVLLPYEKEEYIKSFDNKENIEAFNTLYNKAYKILPIVASKKEHTSAECYEMLGHSLADKSNILLALWDGKDLGKAGGTSEVVKYQREGVNENRFDAMDGNAIFIIKTPRISNPIDSDFKVQREYLGEFIKDKDFYEIFSKIDEINKELKAQENVSKNILENIMQFSGNKARANQKKFKRASILILILSAIAFASLEYMHSFQKEHFIVGYGAGILLAFGVYAMFMRNGKVQEDFVYSRALAESIRVQNALNGGKIDMNVAKEYLKEEHHKYTWIKVILTNLYTIEKTPFIPRGDKSQKPKDWIEGQINYFKNQSIPQRQKRYHFFEKIEKIFYRLGLTLLIAMFIWYFFGEHIVKETKEFKHILHTLVFASGISLLIATFIGEKYLKIEGFEEELYHFKKMLNKFTKAKKELQNVKEYSPEYEKIVKDIAKKALDENSRWVVMHDSRKAKPSVE